MYKQLIGELRTAYDRMVEERDNKQISSWKAEERRRFLSLLLTEGKKRLLEIGAGTGAHSEFFQDNGLEVIATDLSTENVKRCQEKGLTVYTMDFLGLEFPPSSFDAVYALNCLLHVPKKDLSRVLEAVKTLLKPGGLFYIGVYGGQEYEGTWPEDHYKPKRFFSFLSDEQIEKVATRF